MGFVCGNFKKNKLATIIAGGGAIPTDVGDPIFKLQDHGNGRGFHDQVGFIPWKIYKPLKTSDSGVYGNSCMVGNGGVTFYYKGSENTTDINDILKDVLHNPHTLCGWFRPTAGNPSGNVVSVGMGNRDYEYISLRINISGIGANDMTPGYGYDCNKWTHIALVQFPGAYRTSLVKVYINGELKTQHNHGIYSSWIDEHPTAEPYINIGNIRIEGFNSGYPYEGSVDDLCWFVGDITNGQGTYEVPTRYM